MRGGEGDALGGRMGVMQLQLKTAAAEMSAMAGGAGNEAGGYGGQRTKEDKVSHWGQQETRELIAIRAEFERDLTVVRRNKTLWEAVSLRMRDKGYLRSPDQCKCKWKNLINRYKDKETGEAESGRQCPFFEELHAVFTERPAMHRLLLESEAGTPRSKNNPKRLTGDRSYDEVSDDDEEEDEDSNEERPNQSKKRKAEKSVQQHQQIRASVSGKSKAANTIHELLQDFMQKQQQVECHWWEMMERRASERQRFEQEWRQSMEKLERERLMLERAWRERDEQRRMREECRAEKRDALLNALLNKFIQNDL